MYWQYLPQNLQTDLTATSRRCRQLVSTWSKDCRVVWTSFKTNIRIRRVFVLQCIYIYNMYVSNLQDLVQCGTFPPWPHISAWTFPRDWLRPTEHNSVKISLRAKPSAAMGPNHRWRRLTKLSYFGLALPLTAAEKAADFMWPETNWFTNFEKRKKMFLFCIVALWPDSTLGIDFTESHLKLWFVLLPFEFSFLPATTRWYLFNVGHLWALVRCQCDFTETWKWTFRCDMH